MKLLKNLTKVVSVALASVSVFSAGLSASALGEVIGTLKRGDLEYKVIDNQDKKGRRSFSLRKDVEGLTDYFIARFGPRDTYSCVFREPTGKLSSWYSIDTPISGSMSRKFQISATGDECFATNLRFSVRKSLKDDKKWLLEGKNEDVRTDYIVKFRDVKGKSTDANQAAYIYEGSSSKGKKPIAIFYSKDCSLNVRCIVAFLSAVGIPHK